MVMIIITIIILVKAKKYINDNDYMSRVKYNFVCANDNDESSHGSDRGREKSTMSSPQE